MAIGSNINPNYPIPGLDQSSKGFRDNFAIIKREIEEIQGTTIQFAGGIISDPYMLGSSSSLVIDTVVNGAIIGLDPPAQAIQYNENGLLKGNVNLTYDSSNISVGLGTVPVNIKGSLSTVGPVSCGGNIVINETDLSTPAYVRLVTPTNNAVLSLSNTDNVLTFGTGITGNIQIVTAGTEQIRIDTNGNVGIGTTDLSARLSIIGNSKDLGRLYTNPPLSDSIFRLSTSDVTSTIGLGLEHRGFGWLGGLRINAQGTVSIHTGESQDGYLSTSSAAIAIDTAGSVGIGSFAPSYNLDINGTLRSKGITDPSTDFDKKVGINNLNPYYTLDVVGDVASSGAGISTVAPIVTIDTNPIVIDSWPTNEFRTARYTVHAVSGTIPTEVVNIWEILLYHANDTAYLNTITNFDTGGSIGTITALVSAGFMDLSFTGVAPGIRIKLAKMYVTS